MKGGDKMKKLFVATLVIGALSFLSIGCGKKEEKKPTDNKKTEKPAEDKKTK